MILVRRETSPEDVGGMAVAQGILTATGGKTSHAAVVARGWGKCCIVGAEKFNIDFKTLTMQAGGKLDTDARDGASRWWVLASRPLRNPLTVGSLLGVLLSLTGWTLPGVLSAPLDLLGNMAVPSMLLAYGIALRLGPGLGKAGSVSELVTTSGLKLVAQPVVAWFVASTLLGVHGHALLALVVTSALPTAQNIFVHATRYERATVLARDTILITTIGAVPVILALTWLLGR